MFLPIKSLIKNALAKDSMQATKPSIKLFDGKGNNTRQTDITEKQLKEIFKILN